MDLKVVHEIDKGKSYVEVPSTGIGDISDGYHTFNELYHHRAVLFSFIVNSNPGISFKSHKHHDGTMYDDMFIVGITTPYGQVTYHYDVDPYWNYFQCPEVPTAPKWDGHTPDQAIERILKWSLSDPNQLSLFEGPLAGIARPKLFVSIPMAGRKPEEVKEEMKYIQQKVERRYNLFSGSLILLDTFFEEDLTPLECLGKSISYMSQADIVYMAIGWESSRGCIIEHRAAQEYGKIIIYN